MSQQKQDVLGKPLVKGLLAQLNMTVKSRRDDDDYDEEDEDDPGYDIDGDMPGVEDYPSICEEVPIACGLHYNPGPGTWSRVKGSTKGNQMKGRKTAVVEAAVVSTKSVDAEIRPVENSENSNGEFEMILSKDNLDRDAENLWADEWMHPLPAKIHMDTDHAFSKGMSVPHTAGSGVPSITENGDLLVKGTYAGTPHGQLTRQLVKEGHIWQGSVAYQTHMLDDGRIVRELLNGTFTGVPANTEAVVLSSKSKTDITKASKPYGNVRYADPGYQDDKKPRYPIDTEDHVRAALSYFGQSKNRTQYTASQQAAILGRIKSRARALGIQVSDDSKTLMLALLKAVTTMKSTKGLPGVLDLTQSTPAKTIANDDVGAQSVYDDDYDGDYDNDSDSGDADWDSATDLLQAVHDAACALGAECAGDDMKSISTFATALKDAGNQLNSFVTKPVSQGWDFVVAGKPGEQMYTLLHDGEMFGAGKVDDLKMVKAKASNADGEDAADESDSDEDDADEEKSDSSDTKSYELTLADGSTIVIDGSKLKEYDPSNHAKPEDPPEKPDEKPVDAPETANANTEPPENSAGTEQAAHPIDAQSVAASGASQADVAAAVEAEAASDDAAETKSESSGDVEKKVTPGDVAAKARLRMLTFNNTLTESTPDDDSSQDSSQDGQQSA